MTGWEWVLIIELTIVAISAIFSIINTILHWGSRRYPCDGVRHKYMKKLPNGEPFHPKK